MITSLSVGVLLPHISQQPEQRSRSYALGVGERESKSECTGTKDLVIVGYSLLLYSHWRAIVWLTEAQSHTRSIQNSGTFTAVSLG